MAGITAWLHSSAPVTLTRRICSQRSTVTLENWSATICSISAALLTRMSTPPNVSTAAVTIAWTDAASVMSTVTAVARAPMP
jgi:hypothetical protein